MDHQDVCDFYRCQLCGYHYVAYKWKYLKCVGCGYLVIDEPNPNGQRRNKVVNRLKAKLNKK